MSERRLVIIDGYSLLFRAFFATRYLSTSDGRPTNALYGFTSMLFLLLERERPDAVVVAMDAPGKTFRHAEYSEYKGTRRETADELQVQLPIARDLINALGIPTVEVTGYEADDVVGTISCLAEENGYKTTIVTGDLDTLQLVDQCVQVMTMRQGVSDVVYYTPEKVMERYGFEPKFIPDYKALVGDTSDNIPGVPGIGEKSASAIIQKFGHLENLLENFDQLDPKFAKKIEPHKDQLLKSKWLATIECMAPVEYDFKPFQLTPEQMEQAKSILELYEFRNHAKRLSIVLGPYLEGFVKGDPAPAAAAAAAAEEAERLEVELSEAKSLAELEQWVNGRPYSIYFESGQAQPSMFEDPGRIAYVAVEREVRKAAESDALVLLERAPGQAILHDAKPIYRAVGSDWGAMPRFDSMVAGYVLQSGRSAYALRDLIQGYLDVRPAASEEAAAALWMLESVMRERLEKEGQTQVLDDIELPLIPILAEMERHGVLVNREFLADFSKSLEVTIDQTKLQVYEQAGQEFNIGSPKQLGEVLFEKLCIPGPKKTKTGYATGAEILQQLAPSNPICTDILTWRELTKLKSTYSDALPKMIAEDGRIHTHFNQTTAATGRLSSNEPNLQNIPIRTELGRQIRKAFVAAPGFRLAAFDYSQIELRILAHLSGDEALVEAFRNREDVHTVTAALMYGVEPGQVSREQRGYSKMLNYAVAYGVTDFGLANQLGGDFSISEAKALITQYFERFQKIKAYMDGAVQEARSKGFTTTIFGRRRYFGDIHALNRNERMGAERQAMNAPIQGAAADMIKLAMIRVRKELEGCRSRMLLQVHDELVFELAEGEDHLIEPIRAHMENALPLEVPVEVDAKVGHNWGEMALIERPTS